MIYILLVLGHVGGVWSTCMVVWCFWITVHMADYVDWNAYLHSLHGNIRLYQWYSDFLFQNIPGNKNQVDVQIAISYWRRLDLRSWGWEKLIMISWLVVISLVTVSCEVINHYKIKEWDVTYSLRMTSLTKKSTSSLKFLLVECMCVAGMYWWSTENGKSLVIQIRIKSRIKLNVGRHFSPNCPN